MKKFLSRTDFENHIGKTVEGVEYQKYDGDCPNDIPTKGIDKIVRFTDGSQCLIWRHYYFRRGTDEYSKYNQEAQET